MVPQTDRLDFRPLAFCVSQGYYASILRFKGGGVVGTHRHPSPVRARVHAQGWLLGSIEHDWKASAGTYVFEPRAKRTRSSSTRTATSSWPSST